MNQDKDYYSILGVLPDAEDIVIRAAYRALAQRYHPDHFGGSPEKAHVRMSELNEAYAVLSDAEARKAYDQLRGAKSQSGGSQFSDIEEKAPQGEDPLDKDWRIALKYYPDLAALEQRLLQFSWKLANTYRACLLETRQFEPRESLAAVMESHFLHAYFGDNERNIDFARRLIVARERKAALALNEAVRVLGSDADPGRVITQIAREFDVGHLAVDKDKISSLVQATRVTAAPTNLFTQMLRELGGSFAWDGDAIPTAQVKAGEACRVEYDGKSFKFPSEYEFRAWFRREVQPIAERLVRHP